MDGIEFGEYRYLKGIGLVTISDDIPCKILAFDKTKCRVLTYIPERTATRIVRTYDGLTGICKCSSCDRTISVYDKFCKHCGAMFVGTNYQ